MKAVFSILATFLLALGLAAQEATTPAPPDTRELPPEEWDGEIGADGRIPELGHYVAYEDGEVNFRVWNNKTRVYFLDKDGVVVEPPYDLVTANLRIRGDRDPFIRMANRGMYLEGREFLRPPFIFFTVLRLQDSEGDREDEVYSFMFSQDYIKPGGSD